jgi:uncharacterized alpha-E superfamily protein
MLSRVADALFWMSRYLERAEQIARLLDVAFHLELDLSGVVSGSYDVHWVGVLGTLQQPPLSVVPYPDLGRREAIMRWLTLEGENPNSIATCIARSRVNARGVRGSLPAEVWRELNKLYWQLRDGEFVGSATDSPSTYYAAVLAGNHLIQGACDALMVHDEGWHFIQLGRCLERADVTTRAVDVHHELLRGLVDPADMPLVHLHWAGVLRGCAAYHAYQRVYVGRVEPARVIELLLNDPAMPRSTRFCLECSANSLAAMSGDSPRRSEAKAERLIGRALSELRYADLGLLVGTDNLHRFLADLLRRCSEASTSVQEQYPG